MELSSLRTAHHGITMRPNTGCRKNKGTVRGVLRFLLRGPFPFLLVIFIAFFLFQVVFVLVFIPSESMEPLLKSGDILIGQRQFKEVERGAVYVFYREDGTPMIKRLIGIGGDHVEITPEGGVKVNGVRLEEPYTNNTGGQCGCSYDVPEGFLFFLGDNRSNSKDSRYWDNPFVAEDQLVAKAVLKIWAQPKKLKKVA